MGKELEGNFGPFGVFLVFPALIFVVRLVTVIGTGLGYRFCIFDPLPGLRYLFRLLGQFELHDPRTGFWRVVITVLREQFRIFGAQR